MVLRLRRTGPHPFSLRDPPLPRQTLLHPHEQPENRDENGESRRTDFEMERLDRRNQRRRGHAYEHRPMKRILLAPPLSVGIARHDLLVPTGILFLDKPGS